MYCCLFSCYPQVVLQVLRYCPSDEPYTTTYLPLLPAAELPQPSMTPPYLLLYLTLNTKEDDEANAVCIIILANMSHHISLSSSFLSYSISPQDILYQYPSNSDLQSSTRQLLALRGVFLTLSDTLSQLTNSHLSRYMCAVDTAATQKHSIHVVSSNVAPCPLPVTQCQ